VAACLHEACDEASSLAMLSKTRSSNSLKNDLQGSELNSKAQTAIVQSAQYINRKVERRAHACRACSVAQADRRRRRRPPSTRGGGARAAGRLHTRARARGRPLCYCGPDSRARVGCCCGGRCDRMPSRASPLGALTLRVTLRACLWSVSLSQIETLALTCAKLGRLFHSRKRDEKALATQAQLFNEKVDHCGEQVRRIATDQRDQIKKLEENFEGMLRAEIHAVQEKYWRDLRLFHHTLEQQQRHLLQAQRSNVDLEQRVHSLENQLGYVLISYKEDSEAQKMFRMALHVDTVFRDGAIRGDSIEEMKRQVLLRFSFAFEAVSWVAYPTRLNQADRDEIYLLSSDVFTLRCREIYEACFQDTVHTPPYPW